MKQVSPTSATAKLATKADDARHRSFLVDTTVRNTSALARTDTVPITIIEIRNTTSLLLRLLGKASSDDSGDEFVDDSM